MNQLRVLIADEHPPFVDSLAALLEIDPTINVVGRARTADELLSLAASLTPHVILVEADGTELDGAQICPAVLEMLPGASVILMTTAFANHDYADLLKSRAFDYIDKERAGIDLLDILWSLAAHYQTYDLAIAPLRPRRIAFAAARRIGEESLSSYERACLRLLEHGMNRQEIAELLRLPEPSLEVCIRRAMLKLHLKSWDELEAYSNGNNRGPTMRQTHRIDLV